MTEAALRIADPPADQPATPAADEAAPKRRPRPPRPAPDPAAALLWDLPQAAAALAVSARTLKRMADGEELPPGAVVRLGRRRLFSRRALEAWIAAGCPTPTTRRKR